MGRLKVFVCANLSGLELPAPGRPGQSRNIAESPLNAGLSFARPIFKYDHMSNWSDEETDDPIHADRRNFYKVEQWSRDGQRVVDLVFAGTSLDKARRIFERMTQHRPRIRLTIRQRTRVLEQWPNPRQTQLLLLRRHDYICYSTVAFA